VRAVTELDGEHGGTGQVPAARCLNNRAIKRHSMRLLGGLGGDAEETRLGRDHLYVTLVGRVQARPIGRVYGSFVEKIKSSPPPWSSDSTR